MNTIIQKQRTTIKLPIVGKQKFQKFPKKPACTESIQRLCGSPTSSYTFSPFNCAENSKLEDKAFHISSRIIWSQSLSGLCCEAPRGVFN